MLTFRSVGVPDFHIVACGCPTERQNRFSRCECFRSGMSVVGGANGLLKMVESSGMEMWCLRMFF